MLLGKNVPSIWLRRHLLGNQLEPFIFVGLLMDLFDLGINLRFGAITMS